MTWSVVEGHGWGPGSLNVAGEHTGMASHDHQPETEDVAGPDPSSRVEAAHEDQGQRGLLVAGEA